MTADLATTDGWRAALRRPRANPSRCSCTRPCRRGARSIPRSPSRKRPGTAWSTPTCARASFHRPRARLAHAGDRPGRRRFGPLRFHHPAARRTPRNIPHYSASKAGQTMVVKELARALGPAGIRYVNALALGAVPAAASHGLRFRGQGPASGVSAPRRTWPTWRWRCSPTGSPADSSPALLSPSTAASLSTTDPTGERVAEARPVWKSRCRWASPALERWMRRDGAHRGT